MNDEKTKFYKRSILCVFLALANPSSSQSLLTYINSTGQKVPVETLFEWQIKRGQILDSMQAAMGKLPNDRNRPPFNNNLPALPPFNTQVKDSLKTHHYIRYNIRFTVANDEDLTAYLYVPISKNKQKFPAMLALQPTGIQGKKIVDGQGPRPNRAYGKELAERGYIVIAPDYPSFGDLKDYNFKTDRYQSGTMKSIFDNMRCVDLLQARADVDPERIGVIGHSLGGHDAIFTGAFDLRLKVIVSSCGWTKFDYDNLEEADVYVKEYGGRLGDWAQERYMPLLRDKYKLNDRKIPFDFDEVIAALAPRAFFSNSPLGDADFNVNGVKAGIATVSKVYDLFRVEDKLQVRYPESKHDFPPHVRIQAYQFIDKILNHFPAGQFRIE